MAPRFLLSMANVSAPVRLPRASLQGLASGCVAEARTLLLPVTKASRRESGTAWDTHGYFSTLGDVLEDIGTNHQRHHEMIPYGKGMKRGQHDLPEGRMERRRDRADPSRFFFSQLPFCQEQPSLGPQFWMMQICYSRNHRKLLTDLTTSDLVRLSHLG